MATVVNVVVTWCYCKVSRWKRHCKMEQMCRCEIRYKEVVRWKTWNFGSYSQCYPALDIAELTYHASLVCYSKSWQHLTHFCSYAGLLDKQKKQCWSAHLLWLVVYSLKLHRAVSKTWSIFNLHRFFRNLALTIGIHWHLTPQTFLKSYFCLGCTTCVESEQVNII